jgi:hypothetical protein
LANTSSSTRYEQNEAGLIVSGNALAIFMPCAETT